MKLGHRCGGITHAQELYDAREAIELCIADKAFENITADDIKELEESINRQIELSKQGDAYGFMEEDTYFHRFIMGKYQNNTLLKMHHNMTDCIFLLGVKIVSSAKRLQESIENHRRQIKCLKAKDKQGFLREVAANQISGYLFASSLNNSPAFPLVCFYMQKQPLMYSVTSRAVFYIILMVSPDLTEYILQSISSQTVRSVGLYIVCPSAL